MKTKTLSCRTRWSWAGLLLALAPAAFAGDVLKTNNTDNLNLGTSWVAGTPPGASDVAVWDATVTSTNAVLLGASAHWAGIRIANVGGPVILNDDGNTLTLGASGIDMSGAAQNLTLGCMIALGNNQTWNAGTNSLMITNANTGSSGLTLTGATVFAGSDTAFGDGTGTLTLNGCSLATLNGTGHRTLANPLVAATGTSNNLYGFNGGSWTTYTGTLSGSGTIGCVNPTGGGRTDFNGAMSGFTGTLWYHNVAGGSSVIVSGDGSASAHFATDGTTTSGAYNWFFVQVPSTIFYMGELSGTGGTVTAIGNYTIFEVGALNTSTTYAGTIGQNGPQVALNKVGTGTLELSGPNNDAFSYRDTTTVSAGTLWVSGTLSRSSGVTVNDGATLKVTAHGATATITTGGALTLGSAVGGATNQFVEVSSTGTAPIQAGSLTLNGPTTISILSGTLLAGETYPLIGYTTLDGAGNFVLGTLPAGVTANLVTNGTGIALAVLTAPGLNDVWNGNLSGIWDVTNTANWMLNGVTGKTFHQGDLVRFDDTASGTTTVSNTVTVSPSSITVSNTTKAYTIGGSAIAGGASLTKSGTNTLTLTGTNTFTGDITLNAGTLTIGGAGQLGGGVYTGGISNNGALYYTSSAAQRLSGIISGAGTLAKDGTGTLALSGTNTFTGGVTLTGGPVFAGTDTALGDGTGTLTLNGCTLATLNGTGHRTLANPLVVATGTSNTLLGFDGGSWTTYTGTLSGSGTIGCVNPTGGGRTDFNGDMSGFTGTLWYHNVAGGSSVIVSGDGSASAHFVTDGTTTSGAYNWFFVQVPSSTFAMGELSGTGGTVTAIGNYTIFEVGALNTSTTYAGTIGQNGPQVALNKVGTGTLELSGPNNDAYSYTDTTTVSAGTLWVSGTLSRSSGVTVNDGATLKVTAHAATAAIATAGALTLGSSGACALGFVNLSSTTVAPVSVADLVVNSSVTVHISGKLAVGQLPLIHYTATKSGAGTFVLGPLPPGVSATLVDNPANQSVDLNVTAAPACLFTDLSGVTNRLYAGAAYTASVIAGGSTPLTYLWKRNGTTPVGANSPFLTLAGVTTDDSGSYSVTVTNASGLVQSATNYLVVLPATGNPALVMATGPTAYWPLNEATGPTAFDYAGRYDATYASSGVTYGVAGPVGQNVVTLNGNGGTVVTAPYAAALNPSGAFTVEAWLKPAVVDGTLRAPLSSSHLGNPRSGWLLYVSSAGWNFRTYNQNGTATAVDITASTSPVAGTWQQVTLVWDGTQGQIYVNGVLGATSAATSFVANTDGPFTIGNRSLLDGYWWGGSVGGVAVYDRALTPEEIQSHAQNAPILQIGQSGGQVVLTWVPAGGDLQAAPVVTGPYTNVPAATSPWTNTPAAGREFWRVKF